MSVFKNLIELVKLRIGNLDDALDTKIALALQLSLNAFNMVPVVTYFSFESDEENIAQISDLLVTYAAYIILNAQSVEERGKEWAQLQNGLLVSPPNVSDQCFSMANEMWRMWNIQVRDLKQSESFYTDFVIE